MELKKLNQFTDRELLELILSNQIKIKMELKVVYNILFEQNPELAERHWEHFDSTFIDSLESHDEFKQQIEKLTD